MPNYSFVCRTCGDRREAFSSVAGLAALEHTMYCTHCARQMDYDWSRGRHVPFKAFVTEHVTGKPMHIGSLHELRQIERRYGVNFPAYTGSKLGFDQETTWIDAHGKTRRD